MKTKLIAVFLGITIPIAVWATEDEKYQTDYDVVAATINSSTLENSISFYKNNQIILMKPNPKAKDKTPVPFISNIKPNGDLSAPRMDKNLSKLGNTGTIAFDSIKQTFYFAKYDKMEKDYALYEAKMVKGKLSSSKMKIDGTYQDRAENNFMVDAGWSYRTFGLTGFRNPSLAKNGNRIYFTAAIKQKEYKPVGASDIWYIDRRNDGTWTKPTNAGRGVNTSGKEDYAFCAGDSVLYFSTSSIKNGIELYKSVWKDSAWAKATRLAGPFSSVKNDQNLIIRENQAFFVSNRNQKGKDDIYLFRKKPEPPIVPEKVVVPPPPAPPTEVEDKYTWEFVLFNFDFDQNKLQLNPELEVQFKELVEEMKHFPGETFEIAGHTDERGSDAYNQKLSEQRANFIKSLLVKEGFPADKIIAKGFGEKMPIVPNAKTEEEHEENRRCEITIVNKDNGK